MKNILKMNIALFTSNHLRHKYIATEIAKTLSLKLIICEEKSKIIQQTETYNDEDRFLLENHFQNRKDSEEQFFGEFQDFPSDVVRTYVAHGTINSLNTLELLKEYKIDCILLFGTSIIKPIIIQEFPNKVINLHLGLSPYYKGSGTNFFPIVNNEFECIGATIHLATDAVDAGAILHQFRPDSIQEDDDIHQLGNKVIQKAGEIYPKIVNFFLLKKIKPCTQIQSEESKVYRIKDFNVSALEIANATMINGGVKNYLKHKNQRLAAKPIVSNYNE